MQKDPQKQYLMNDITLLMAVCMKYVFFCLECCIAGELFCDYEQGCSFFGHSRFNLLQFSFDHG